MDLYTKDAIIGKWYIPKSIFFCKDLIFFNQNVYICAQTTFIMGTYEYIFHEFRGGHIAPFYKTMYPELLVYTSRMLGEDYAFLAEDCVQDAVFKAYQQVHSFTTSLQWKVFLYTCIRNEAISILRKAQSQRNYLGQVKDYEEDFSLQFIEQETLTLLYAAIDALPEKYRALFSMSFEQGMKNSEIAEQLQIAEITVKKQKARIIELLRKHIEVHTDRYDALSQRVLKSALVGLQFWALYE